MEDHELFPGVSVVRIVDVDLDADTPKATLSIDPPTNASTAYARQEKVADLASIANLLNSEENILFEIWTWFQEQYPPIDLEASPTLIPTTIEEIRPLMVALQGEELASKVAHW